MLGRWYSNRTVAVITVALVAMAVRKGLKREGTQVGATYVICLGAFREMVQAVKDAARVSLYYVLLLSLSS